MAIRKRWDVNIKPKSDKNGNTYYEGYSPVTGKVIVFLNDGESPRGYVGKVSMSVNITPRNQRNSRYNTRY